MKIEEALKEKIPLLDDVTYFIPKGVDTVDEYKKFLAYTEEINQVIIQEQPNDSDNYDEDEIYTEEFFYEEEMEDILLFESIENKFDTNEKSNKKENIEDSKKEQSSSNNEEQKVASQKDKIKEDVEEIKPLQLIECQEINLDEEFANIEITDDIFKENTKEVEIEKEIKTTDMSNTLSSVIGASLDINIKDLIFSDEDEESEGEGDDGKNTKSETKKEDGLFEEVNFINKAKEKLSEEEDDSFKDMLSKINKMNDSDEDELIGMLGKINLRKFENDEH